MNLGQTMPMPAWTWPAWTRAWSLACSMIGRMIGRKAKSAPCSLRMLVKPGNASSRSSVKLQTQAVPHIAWKPGLSIPQ